MAEKATDRIHIKIAPSEKAAAEKLARAKGLSLGGLIKQQLRNAVKRVERKRL